MSEDLIQGLLKKRNDVSEQIHDLQNIIFHIDATLKALGYKRSLVKKQKRIFRNGELIALVGEAERKGIDGPTPIAAYVAERKGLNFDERSMRRRLVASVKECRKRTTAIVKGSASRYLPEDVRGNQ